LLIEKETVMKVFMCVGEEPHPLRFPESHGDGPYCTVCGKKMVAYRFPDPKKCKRCGGEVLVMDAFCGHCGERQPERAITTVQLAPDEQPKDYEG
jgi:predicted amidophosphoribosyltransferase